MKKKIASVLTVLWLCTTLFSATQEGVSIVGSIDSFPEGLFAATNMFPKDTLIEIVNLEKSNRSKAVVTGASAPDGVLISLSPVLAKALNIEAGKMVQVRVLIPPHVPEEGADPSLSLQKHKPTTNQPYYPESKKHTASHTEPKPTPQPETAIEPLSMNDRMSSQQKPENKSTAEPTIAESYEPPKEHQKMIIPPDFVSTPVPPNKEKVEAEKLPKTVDEPSIPTKESKEDPVAPHLVDTPEPPQKETEESAEEPKTVHEPLAQPKKSAELPISPAFVTTPVPPEEKTAKEVEPPNTIDAPTAPTEQNEDTVSPVLTANPVPIQSKDAAEASDTVETESAPLIVQDASGIVPPYSVGIPVIPEEAVLAAEELPEEFTAPVPIATQANKQPEEPVAPNKAVPEAAPVIEQPENIEEIRLPSEVSPIETSSDAEKEIHRAETNKRNKADNVETAKATPTSAEEEKELLADKIIPEEGLRTSDTESIISKEFVLVPTEPREPISTEDTAPLIFDLKPEETVEKTDSTILTKGKFYVQIGCFIDSVHVNSFMAKYRKDYPVLVEEKNTGSCIRYKIYVGPLQRDERGAILETFKEYGFTDAFLKKGE